MAANSDSSVKRRGKGRPFEKGQSGNPSGRPKIPDDIKEAFRALTPAALETLTQIINNKDAKDADRIRASEVVLDRGWGKPVQAVDLDAKNIPQVVFVGMEDVAD